MPVGANALPKTILVGRIATMDRPAFRSDETTRPILFSRAPRSESCAAFFAFVVKGKSSCIGAGQRMTSPKHLFIVATAALLLAGCEQVPEKTARSGTRFDGPHGKAPLPAPDALNSEPVYLTGEAPVFSTKLMLEGVRSGYAVMRFIVTKDGRAIRPKAIAYSHGQFAAGVAHVMPTWKFQPAHKDGHPVDREVEMRFDFGEEMGRWRSKSR
ncbi:MAG: energy transducer TonB [Opitutae bacterium]|nr:energy transducer TonB [Opitutae bacterium]